MESLFDNMWVITSSSILSHQSYGQSRPNFAAADIVSHFTFSLISQTINFCAEASHHLDLKLSHCVLSFRLLIWTYNYINVDANQHLIPVIVM